MSSEEDKFKHSKRIHHKETAIHKQQKIALQYGADRRLVEDEPHRFAKHHAMDCGVPNCPMCSSPRKLNGEKTIQEKRFEQNEEYIYHHHKSGVGVNDNE